MNDIGDRSSWCAIGGFWRQHFTIDYIFQFVQRIPTEWRAAISLVGFRQFHIICATMHIDAHNGLTLSCRLPDFIVYPRTLMGMFAYHHNKGLSPTNAHTQVSCNGGIRHLVRTILLFLDRAVANITAMVSQPLFETVKGCFVLTIMRNENVVHIGHRITLCRRSTQLSQR